MATDGSVRGDRELVKSQCESGSRISVGSFQEPSSEVQVLLAVDFDMSVPFVVWGSTLLPSAAFVADRVAGVADRETTDVANKIGFFGVKLVLAFRSQDHKRRLVANVLEVCLSVQFPPVTRRLGDVDAIFADEFPID